MDMCQRQHCTNVEKIEMDLENDINKGDYNSDSDDDF